jgi:Kef-type K+ transport system membrane component KefB
VLYEKQELDTLTGRITLGVLILQDLAAILFLAIQPNLGNLQFSVLMMSLVRVAGLVLAAMLLSRYVLPFIFRRVARLPELVQVGALAWCFLIGELGAQLQLSREMGALIAGVALSTFPYALDVTAKVTSLRDFFVTLFFVGLGMQIPMPNGTLILWAAVLAAFVVVSRFLLTFFTLFALRQGLRTSLIPAFNLGQISEFSLVVLALGIEDHHLKYASEIQGMAALAFAFLAALSTLGMGKSDEMARGLIPWLKRWGLRDLDQRRDDTHAEGAQGHGHPQARILFLGFFRTASSLLEELQRHSPDLIRETAVVDFSPVARAGLVARKVPVIYGDISQRDTLLHAGVEKAEILICTVPDALLKGINNERLVRLLRGLNPKAKIIATADVLSHASMLLEAGADYVSVARLQEANDLLQAVVAAAEGLIDEKRTTLKDVLAGRSEVLP